MPFNPLQRFTSLHRVATPPSPSTKSKGKERLDLVVIPTSSLIIERIQVTSSRHSIASTASSSSSVTLEEAMMQNVTLEQRETRVVPHTDNDHLYLRGGTYILLGREPSPDGEVFTYLGPNGESTPCIPRTTIDHTGHRLQTHLGPSDTPIKCLLLNHKVSLIPTHKRITQLTSQPKLIRTDQDQKRPSSWYHIDTHEKWLLKNGRVECSACGATLRERTVKQ